MTAKTVDCPECGETLDASRPWGAGYHCPRCDRQLTLSRPAPPRSASTGVIVAIGVAVFLAVTGLTAVPVIGILAAIAIPNFLVMQMRAKRSEAPANLDAIRVAERAYHAEWDEHVPVPPTPDLVPGRTPTAFEGGGLSAFQDLGWVATSPVYCRYNVITHGVHDFLATAECDIDGDGVYAVYEATPDSKATLVTSNNVY